jgi:membrane-associated PAP2 superfamily phosphatase
MFLAGCGLFGSEEDTTIRATGTVVFRLAGGVGASIVVRARTTTAADGSFELVHDGGEGAVYSFVINDDPYDGRYSTFSRPINAGETEDFGVVELPRGQR